MNSSRFTFDVLMDSARRSAEWLAGPATCREKKIAHCGSVMGTYDLNTRKWSFYDPYWHTAQAIRGWLALHRLSGEQKWLDSAVHGGDYMLRQQLSDPGNPLRDGAIRTNDGRPRTRHDDENAIHITTISHGLAGLFDLAAVTGERKYSDAAHDAVRWLRDNTFVPDTGFIWQIVDIREGKVLRLEKCRHSASKDSPGAFQKPGIEGSAFWYGWKWFGKDDDRNIFKRMADFLVADQDRKSGCWPDWAPNRTEGGRQVFHGRYNLWLAMPLLYAEDSFGGQKYLKAALLTGQFYRASQSPDGVITQKIREDGKLYTAMPQTSTTAMAALLWLRLLREKWDQDLADGLLLALQYLLDNQIDPDWHDAAMRGAFYEGSGSRTIKGPMRDFGSLAGLQLVTQLLLGLKAMGMGSVETWIASKRPFSWQGWPGENAPIPEDEGKDGNEEAGTKEIKKEKAKTKEKPKVMEKAKPKAVEKAKPKAVEKAKPKAVEKAKPKAEAEKEKESTKNKR